MEAFFSTNGGYPEGIFSKHHSYTYPKDTGAFRSRLDRGRIADILSKHHSFLCAMDGPVIRSERRHILILHIKLEWAIDVPQHPFFQRSGHSFLALGHILNPPSPSWHALLSVFRHGWFI